MKFKYINALILTYILIVSYPSHLIFGTNSNQKTYKLPDFNVIGQKTANIRPAITYESLVSSLDFDPRIDLLSRNMPEAQGDINIRGSIFEATGIRVGSATIFDPQTGHYITELPIAPEMLTKPNVYTGSENSLKGFNSTAGTICYKWSLMQAGGSSTIGLGQNQLNFQRIHNAWLKPLDSNGDNKIGFEAEYSRSESNGTNAYSDHDFNRLTSRIQWVSPNYQADLFAGYQDKFFGQIGMYTGDIYGDPKETEKIKTSLIIFNYQFFGDIDFDWELTAYYRKNNDHYLYDRLNPNYRWTWIHQTDVLSLGWSGIQKINKNLKFNYNFQILSDKIVSSTLEQGYFTDRNYLKIGFLPEVNRPINENKDLIFKTGITFDDTNRNNSFISPILEINLLTKESNNNSDLVYISYSKSTQLVGYGAIGGSKDSGLFRSNKDLKREKSTSIEIGHKKRSPKGSLENTIFYRFDKDLVDWTYANQGARSAKNVDIENFGYEFIATRYWNKIHGIASYTHIAKSENYPQVEDQEDEIVGSFYALNFPEQRATLGIVYRPNDLFEFRLDNEWRKHAENDLRTGPDQAFFSQLCLSFFPYQKNDLELFFAIDKIHNNEFQEIPGTQGRKDQISLGITNNW